MTAGPRRRAREHALKMLYQADIAGLSPDETLDSHWEREGEVDQSEREFAEQLVRAVLGDLDTIDALIAAISHHWTLDRIGTVDRNVIRLAIAEMRTFPATPAAVVIDEAVEIAREYGESQSHAFVNGLLEAARRRLQGRATADTP